LGSGSLGFHLLVGQYPELGRKTARLIPGAKLIEIPGGWHIPHLEPAERFHEELVQFVDRSGRKDCNNVRGKTGQ